MMADIRAVSIRYRLPPWRVSLACSFLLPVLNDAVRLGVVSLPRGQRLARAVASWIADGVVVGR